jgi:uncharacterized protein with predicted RNA binding PUA domain
MNAGELSTLRTVARYQFGAGAGEALFPDRDACTVHRSKSGRPQQVLVDGERVVSYGMDGRFTLGLAGGERLRRALPAPAYRVVLGDESEPYVRDGRNAFAKFVRDADADVRPGDEVLIVHEDGPLLAVGRAELSGADMMAFDTGMAVTVRDSAGPAE